jgi:hypothetical protein
MADPVRDHEALIALSREAPNAWLQQCGRTSSGRHIASDRTGLFLEWLSRLVRKRARACGVSVNPAFAGI